MSLVMLLVDPIPGQFASLVVRLHMGRFLCLWQILLALLGSHSVVKSVKIQTFSSLETVMIYIIYIIYIIWKANNKISYACLLHLITIKSIRFMIGRLWVRIPPRLYQRLSKWYLLVWHSTLKERSRGVNMDGELPVN